MTDETEAVARAIFANEYGDAAAAGLAAQYARLAITALDRHRIERAGEVVAELDVLHVWPQSIADHQADVLTPRQIERLYDVGRVATQAAATIATLRAEVERLTEREAQAKLDSVRKGIEASADHLDGLAKQTPLGHENIQRGASTYNWLSHHARLVRALDAEAIAKGEG